MKKIALIFLIFIYAFSTTGISLQGFYCCEKLKSLKITLADYSKDKEGCCKVKYQTIKVNDTHAPAAIAGPPPVPVNLVHAVASLTNTPDLIYEISHHFASIHAPPLHSSPVYIENCVFRI